jgi:hypothetical protein
MKLADPALPAPDSAVAVALMPPADPHHPPGHSFKLPLHVSARGTALGIIATVAFIWALQWSEKFLVPLLLGVFIAYTLSPVVAWLERWHIKRAVGATLVTVAILAALAGVLYRVQGEIVNVVDELPALTHKITKVLTDNTSGQPSRIQQVQAAAAQFEQATSQVGSSGADAARRAAARRAAPAAAATGGIRVMDWVLAGSMGLATFVSQATMWCSWYFSCCWPVTPSSASWSS